MPAARSHGRSRHGMTRIVAIASVAVAWTGLALAPDQGTVAAAARIVSKAPLTGRLLSDLPPVSGKRMFAATSPFNTPIPAGAAVHPGSTSMVKRLLGRYRARPPVIAVSAWSIPVFRSTRHTRRQSVALTAAWSPYRRMVGVPIPRAAIPDREDDGHLAIIDSSRGWLWEFWQARKRAGRWLASWGTRIRLNSDGVHPHGLSARGSGFSLLAGLVWPGELRRGRIDHALLFSASPAHRTYVPPATESDGTSLFSLDLPEGARLRLDPGVDLSKLRLTRRERAIAVALQRYGMILGDVGSDVVSLYQVHPVSFSPSVAGRQPWKLYDGVAELTGIPWQHLQVLDFRGRQRYVDTDSLRVTSPGAYR